MNIQELLRRREELQLSNSKPAWTPTIATSTPVLNQQPTPSIPRTTSNFDISTLKVRERKFSVADITRINDFIQRLGEANFADKETNDKKNTSGQGLVATRLK
jgi:hypothetical protein